MVSVGLGGIKARAPFKLRRENQTSSWMYCFLCVSYSSQPIHTYWALVGATLYWCTHFGPTRNEGPLNLPELSHGAGSGDTPHKYPRSPTFPAPCETRQHGTAKSGSVQLITGTQLLLLPSFTFLLGYGSGEITFLRA